MNFSEKILYEGLTFDDVLLIPSYSEILPAEIDLRTKLTNQISLNIPLMSAAMDTVTEAEFAIALAREGGVGTIHKNMPIDRQADHVDRVKRSENGVITNPISLGQDNTVAEAEALMHKFRISGVPVCDAEGHLIGIITNRDMKFLEEFNQPIKNVMTSENLVTAPVGTTLTEAKEILRKHKIEKLPIVDTHGVLRGLITIKDIEKVVKYPNSAKDKQGRLLCGAAIGATTDVLDRAGALLDAGADFLVLDSAHGHSRNIVIALQKVKNKYPDAQIIAGNVATAEGTEYLIKAGADAVKVGIGRRIDLYDPYRFRYRCAAGICDSAGGRSRRKVRYSGHRGRRYQVFRRSDQGDCRRCAHSDDRFVVCRLPGEPRRGRTVPGTSFQGLPRHGKPCRYGEGV